MRVLILNQFFYPDHSATSQLMTDLAESLVERGVEVTALAGRSRYNGGAPLPPHASYRGIQIERAWATSFGKGSAAGRLSDYLSFYVGAAWMLARLPRHDVVMALTTPPLIGLVALVVGRARGMRSVALVEDVYPDIAVALGALGPRNPLTRALDYLGRLILRRSERIVVLGDCMRERILAKLGESAAGRIDVIRNWADRAQFEQSRDRENPFIAEHDLKDRFVVLFSGNLGRVNEFETVLEAARILHDSREILFLFVGEGARCAEIKSFGERHGLENLRLLPYQPREAVPHSLAAGHALLVTLAEGLAGLSVPSKAYAILAAGRPILYVGDRRSDVARMVEEEGCGAVVAAGASEQLARIITDWANDRAKLQELGQRARLLFEKRFCRERAVTAYLKTLEGSLGASRRDQLAATAGLKEKAP
ncbi:MAG TPA: glycosyltransferase family 4 protein [Pyrinomonadaceae bacterium]|nr:glycosyltransferase family 4 protein [Pyrinomonadaceae bacterium]